MDMVDMLRRMADGIEDTIYPNRNPIRSYYRKVKFGKITTKKNDQIMWTIIIIVVAIGAIGIYMVLPEMVDNLKNLTW